MTNDHSRCQSPPPKKKRPGTNTGAFRVQNRFAGSPRRAKLWSATHELSLQTLHDAAVHLAHAAFAKIKRLADLFHREFFVVVQNDNESLIAIEAFGDQTHEVIF